jgi:hypothetical protein
MDKDLFRIKMNNDARVLATPMNPITVIDSSRDGKVNITLLSGVHIIGRIEGGDTSLGVVTEAQKQAMNGLLAGVVYAMN